jgi:hypothetical protein
VLEHQWLTLSTMSVTARPGVVWFAESSAPAAGEDEVDDGASGGYGPIPLAWWAS